MKKRLFITSILVAVVTVMAGYNVYTSQNNVEVSDLILTNVEALASNNESDFGWTCEPYVTDHYTESRWDYENGCNASTVVDTYDCNSGLVGSCRTGYVQFYYDCGGHETGRNDQTSTGGCW